MGAKPSYQHNYSMRFNHQQWQQCPLTPYTNIKDPSFGSNFLVYSNKLNSSLQLQKYDLFFNSRSQFQDYQQEAQWRNTLRYVVQISHLRQPETKQLCSSFYHASAYIERSPIRLVQIKDISIGEGLCILYCSLMGFEKLYKKYGYFQPEASLICFNRQGFVKVWMNQNLSKNHPENVYVQSKNKNYSYFVQQLLSLIQDLIDFQGQQSISQFIGQCRINKPYEEIIQVLEKYVRQLQISVPRYIKSIRSICRKKSKVNQNMKDSKPKNRIKNRPSFSSKYGNLQLEQQVYTNPNESQSMRQPLEQLIFKKAASFNQQYRYVNQTSRPSPPVRFHYSIGPGSPTNFNNYSFEIPRKMMSPLTSPPHQTQILRPLSFLKSKRSFTKIEKKVDTDRQMFMNTSLVDK